MTHQGAGWWSVAEWEFREAVRRVRNAPPKGQGRAKAMREIAADYGISLRTLYRWATYDVRPVRCGDYEALFVIGAKRPSQVTPWEKAA